VAAEWVDQLWPPGNFHLAFLEILPSKKSGFNQHKWWFKQQTMVGEWEYSIYNIVASTIPQISILGSCSGGWKMTLPWVDYKPGAGIWDDLYGYNHGISTTITWDISITPISMAIYHHFSSLELHPEVGFSSPGTKEHTNWYLGVRPCDVL